MPKFFDKTLTCSSRKEVIVLTDLLTREQRERDTKRHTAILGLVEML